MAHSKWVDRTDYKYVSVTSRRLKGGSHGEMTSALDNIQKAIIDEKWPYHYRIVSLIDGDNRLRIVIPVKSHADMAEPNPSIYAVLAKAPGSKEIANATMKQFSGSFEGLELTVFANRTDLST